MRRFAQVVCILAVAIGAGLFSFGRYLEPQVDLTNPADVVRLMQDYRASDQHFTASVCSGVGIGFLTLGSFGLAVPWINMMLKARAQPSSPIGSSNPAP